MINLKIRNKLRGRVWCSIYSNTEQYYTNLRFRMDLILFNSSISFSFANGI